MPRLVVAVAAPEPTGPRAVPRPETATPPAAMTRRKRAAMDSAAVPRAVSRPETVAQPVAAARRRCAAVDSAAGP